MKRTAPICAAIGATVLVAADARFTLAPLAVARLLVLGDALGLAALELYALVAIMLLVSRARSALDTHLPLAPIIAAGCLITVLL